MEKIPTTAEVSLLQKGLGFVPTTKFDCFTWLKDLDLFIRKLKWKKFFKQKDIQECIDLGISEEDLPGIITLSSLLDDNTRMAGEGPFTDLRSKSRRNPPPMNYHNLDVFQKVVTDALEKLAQSTCRPFNNLKSEEIQALHDLERDKSLVIKPSNKGGIL